MSSGRCLAYPSACGSVVGESCSLKSACGSELVHVPDRPGIRDWPRAFSFDAVLAPGRAGEEALIEFRLHLQRG